MFKHFSFLCGQPELYYSEKLALQGKQQVETRYYLKEIVRLKKKNKWFYWCLNKNTINWKIRAISIRQPYVEQIMRDTKMIEYRSRPTLVRGNVYIYASLNPEDLFEFKKLKLQPGDLPTGYII